MSNSVQSPRYFRAVVDSLSDIRTVRMVIFLILVDPYEWLERSIFQYYNIVHGKKKKLESKLSVFTPKLPEDCYFFYNKI